MRCFVCSGSPYHGACATCWVFIDKCLVGRRGLGRGWSMIALWSFGTIIRVLSSCACQWNRVKQLGKLTFRQFALLRYTPPPPTPRPLFPVLLLVFSVTQFKIDQNKESGKWKKVNMQRLSPKFWSQQFFLCEIRGEIFYPKFIEICMETPCWCPSVWAPTWRPETNRNICQWVLLQRREFIPRGTLKH